MNITLRSRIRGRWRFLYRLDNGKVMHDAPLSRVVRSLIARGRFDSVVTELELLIRWINKQGVGALAHSVPHLSEARDKAADHLRCLNMGCFKRFADTRIAYLASFSPTGLGEECEESVSAGRLSAEEVARMLYRSFHYVWVSYDLILCLADDLATGAREVMNQLSLDAYQLIDNFRDLKVMLSDLERSLSA